MFFLAWNSRMKSNIAVEKCSSWGLERKNHLKPRRWSEGDEDSPEKYGMP